MKLRKIKFKAWDKKYRELCRVNHIDFEKNTAWIEADNGDHETRHTITRDFEEIIFIQYSGLNDINKVEVYDGFILSNGERTWIVQFNQKDCCFEAIEQNKLKEKWDLQAVLMGISMTAGVVVGNIFENN